MYTKEELFELGRAFAIVCGALGDPHPTEQDYRNGQTWPLRTVKELISEAQEKGVLTKYMENRFTLTLAKVKHDFAQPVPFAMRFDWMRGYYMAQRGLSLAAARKRKGLSQNDLSKALGVLQTMISRWEMGENSPSPAYEKQLQKILEWDG